VVNGIAINNEINSLLLKKNLIFLMKHFNTIEYGFVSLENTHIYLKLLDPCRIFRRKNNIKKRTTTILNL
jgi:hypothetical protein